MRRRVKNSILIFLVTTSLALIAKSCTKSNEKDEGECKVCKAYGTSGIDAQETVCSPEAESTFRSQNAGKEISCN